jgi:hypothetical protein
MPKVKLFENNKVQIKQLLILGNQGMLHGSVCEQLRTLVRSQGKITSRVIGCRTRSLVVDSAIGKVEVTEIKVHCCMFCKSENPQGFMVTNEVWAEARLKKGITCISCLKKRLGRPLTIGDFMRDVGVNAVIFALFGE